LLCLPGISHGKDSTKNMESIAAVTLNWNRAPDTVACLHALEEAGLPLAQAVVVDNGSADDSVAIIRAAYPQAQLLANALNLGFAAGVNVGLRWALEAGFPFVLLLNNDAQVTPDAPRILLEAAERYPRAGILSPLIRYAEDGRIWFAGSYRRRFLPGEHWPAYRSHRTLSPTPRPIDYATGCAMLLRADMLREVGLFDDAYFFYWEDLDLCERARRAGWQVLLVPEAVVHHHVSASLGEESPAKWTYLGRYVPTFYRRYYRWPAASLLVYATWVVIRETLRRNSAAVKPFLRGIAAGWCRRDKTKPAAGSCVDEM
jgi:GT2 family glycosyltransferase